MSFSFMLVDMELQRYFCFNKLEAFNFLQVIHLATHWIQLWSFLPPSDQQELMDTRGNNLVMITQDIFSRLAAF